LTLFVDTSVWSRALRRDKPDRTAEVGELQRALNAGDAVVRTGHVLQELLQGFSGPKALQQIIERFAALPLLLPDRRDHIEAAALRNRCRRAGIQIGTIDALLAQLCIRHDLTMLADDADFRLIASKTGLRIWGKAG
jgi:hypothetical protein